MFAFVHGPSGALHFATAALSAPSCSGLPPVPRPTNQRTRILPSDVSPPADDGCAVTSAPLGRGVELLGDGASAVGVHAAAITSEPMVSAAARRQSNRFIVLPPPAMQVASCVIVVMLSASPPTRLAHDELRREHDASRHLARGTDLSE